MSPEMFGAVPVFVEADSCDAGLTAESPFSAVAIVDRADLLDTNVVSELRRTKPHGGVLSWDEHYLRFELVFVGGDHV